ncbi:MAG: hypothetical protein ACI8WB_005077 [Phenylobacterium sp.]|jgi:hypothetical protein
MTFIIAAAKSIDHVGNLQPCLDLETQIVQRGYQLHHLYIEPLSADWHSAESAHYFRSGCAPALALAQAKLLIEQGHHGVVISGEDNLKSGYSRDERLRLMSVYGADYPLTQAYTDLATAFIDQQNIDAGLFKQVCASLFNNYLSSYRHGLGHDFTEDMLPDQRWYQPLTALFRGVDCANPLVDFSGRLLITSSTLADELNITSEQRVAVKAVAISCLAGDGREHIEQIVRYQHLAQAYQQCCAQSGIDFAKQFVQGKALLETYTCYPVVPMAFLLASGLVEAVEDIPAFLKLHQITVTGGMNLARAPWNNPALNGIITMVERLTSEAGQSVGLVHANGGLGYRQGIILLES